MGLLHFPGASDGVLPVLVMNTIFSISVMKNMARSVLQAMGAHTDDSPGEYDEDPVENSSRERRMSITQFKTLSQNSVWDGGNGKNSVESCVCLCGFDAEEEVSELVSCKHFFHKGCLDKWFTNNHSTCPVCRSIL